MKTPISILQELMVQKKLPLPEYVPGDSLASNNNTTKFRCTVRAGNHTAEGEGTTKKEAKQNSAKRWLELHHVQEENIIIKPVQESEFIEAHSDILDHENKNQINYVGKLNEYASIHRHPYPVYKDQMLSNGQFVVECQFVDQETRGYGTNKKNAKQEAARNMVPRLKEMPITHASALTRSVDSNVEEILRQYAALTNSYSILSLEQNNNDIKIEATGNNTYIAKIQSVEELRDELQKIGLTFKIEVFQVNPYILSMTFEHDKKMVVMGAGVTRQEALNSMVANASLLIENGFRFRRISSDGLY